ncbi:hypothetical protein DM01DRAFT_10251 [Hesseltinella vesiculosa]|uniref:Uncharacterized protein n=1 Tax=Hesseltinella vesiculosa TaxID=101127 RepID=A0A1X2GCY9_9FUNG|nr:hypothetical protein DM01DRAFT_10251 [Hesseltinella vesiculosa]
MVFNTVIAMEEGAKEKAPLFFGTVNDGEGSPPSLHKLNLEVCAFNHGNLSSYCTCMQNLG